MIPFIAFANKEIENQPETNEDMEIICPHCGLLHKIEYGKDYKTGKKNDSISFYDCPQTGKSYLAGVSSKLIIGIKI